MNISVNAVHPHGFGLPNTTISRYKFSQLDQSLPELRIMLAEIVHNMIDEALSINAMMCQLTH